MDVLWICTDCGKQQECDEHRDCGLCPHCGCDSMEPHGAIRDKEPEE